MGGRRKKKGENSKQKNPLLHTRIFSKSDPINRAPAIVLTFNIYSHFVHRSRYMYTWYTYIYIFISIRLYVESSWSVSRAFSDNYTTAKFSNVRSTRFVNRLGDVRFDGQSIKRVSRGFARILRPVSAMFRYTCSLHAFATTKSHIKWSFRIFSPPGQIVISSC